MGRGSQAKAKKLRFFEKKNVHIASQLPNMFCQRDALPPIYHQNKGEEVCFYSAISMQLHLFVLSVFFICVCIYLYLVTYKYL